MELGLDQRCLIKTFCLGLGITKRGFKLLSKLTGLSPWNVFCVPADSLPNYVHHQHVALMHKIEQTRAGRTARLKDVLDIME